MIQINVHVVNLHLDPDIGMILHMHLANFYVGHLLHVYYMAFVVHVVGDKNKFFTIN